MGTSMQLWPEDTIELDDAITSGVTIEGPQGQRRRLWYRLSVEHKSALTEGCDPFVLGTLFTAMRTSSDLVIHGQVSPSLLRNLDEFQAAWACWRPGRYAKIDIVADVERERPRADTSATIMAFSGGVDSYFTAWRHRTGRCGRLRRDLQAGVMVHGFDILLDQHDVFDRAAARSTKMLGSLGMGLIPVATNFRDLGGDWEDVFAAGVASCLTLLQGGYVAGLIASSWSYDQIQPYGSNPATDGMMSSESFQIIHDGAAFARGEKIHEITNWPEVLQYLRVCWRGEHRDRNCGRCEKCIRTVLHFRALGVGLPECFEQDVSNRQILSLRGLHLPHIGQLNEVLTVAKARSISASWVGALEMSLRLNRLMLKAKQIPVVRWFYRFAVRQGRLGRAIRRFASMK